MNFIILQIKCLECRNFCFTITRVSSRGAKSYSGIQYGLISLLRTYTTFQGVYLNYWDTCGSPVIKRLCFFVVFFFSSATKWKNCAIVPSGHWALNTMTTNCDPMRCSHADHACYLDDDWRCHARTGPGHMTNHEIFASIQTHVTSSRSETEYHTRANTNLRCKLKQTHNSANIHMYPNLQRNENTQTRLSFG